MKKILVLVLLVGFSVSSILLVSASKDKSKEIPEAVQSAAHNVPSVVYDLIGEYMNTDSKEGLSVSQGQYIYQISHDLIVDNDFNQISKYEEETDCDRYLFSFEKDGEGVMLFVVSYENGKAIIDEAGGSGLQYIAALNMVERLTGKTESRLCYLFNGTYVLVFENDGKEYVIPITEENKLNEDYQNITAIEQLPTLEDFVGEFRNSIIETRKMVEQVKQEQGEDTIVYGSIEFNLKPRK